MYLPFLSIHISMLCKTWESYFLWGSAGFWGFGLFNNEVISSKSMISFCFGFYSCTYYESNSVTQRKLWVTAFDNTNWWPVSTRWLTAGWTAISGVSLFSHLFFFFKLIMLTSSFCDYPGQWYSWNIPSSLLQWPQGRTRSYHDWWDYSLISIGLCYLD